MQHLTKGACDSCADNVEILLLDCLCLCECPLRLFLSPDFAELFNRPDHGLSNEELLDRLVRLINCGLIFVVDAKRCGAPNTSGLRQWLDNALSGGEDCFVGLTQRGGAVWEKAVNPDWQQFHVFRDGEEEGCVVLEAGTEEYLSRLFTMYEEYCPPIKAPGDPIHLRPWQATYWKTLPVGFRLTYQGIELTPDEITQELKTRLTVVRSGWRRQWGSSLAEGLLEPDEWIARATRAG